MAEIPIERKPRRSVGPLLVILILILLGVAGWYWWTNYGNRTKAEAIPSNNTSLAQSGGGFVTTGRSLNLRRT